MDAALEPRATPGAAVRQLEAGGWRLEIPSGPSRSYRLAQLDDYAHHTRGRFPWRAPTTLRLQARASSPTIPGTWGFGLWNDPFGLALGFSGGARRLPALPNAAWFFFASPPNNLSLRDDLPGKGNLAATFRAPSRQALYLLAAIPVLPGLFLPATSRPLRRLAGRVIRQDAALLSHAGTHKDNPAVTCWQTYSLQWSKEQVRFEVNGKTRLDTAITPHSPLGLVIWIDNQYASFPRDGRLAFGTLPNEAPAWIEIRELEIHSP